MKLLIIITTIILAVNGGAIKKECVKVNDVYYEPEILRKDIDRPYHLTLHYNADTLYFSYSIKENEDDSKAAKINLHTKEFQDIKGIDNGFAPAVDQKKDKVYIGGSDGIFKYNYIKDSTVFMGEKDANIWNMYFNDVLYFSVYPSQFLFVYSEDKSIKFKDLEDTKVDMFVIDKENYVFFTNDTGLYSQKFGSKDAVLYQEYSDMKVRALTTDTNGKVYACLQDGIYAVDKNTRAVDKIIDLEDAFGVAFDSDNNIIYSDADRIVRLIPSDSC